MTEQRPKARKIILECDHILWLYPPVPRTGETLYCRPCDAYQAVGPAHANGRVYEDTWSWIHQGRFIGRCEECQEERDTLNWHYLRDLLESHHLRKHAGSSLIFDTPQPIPTPKLPRNSPPPF